MEAKTILVCVGERQWTMEALHLACSLASDTGWTVTLVKMVDVEHPFHLGQGYAYWHYTPAEREAMRDYLQTIEDYGVTCEPLVYQYVDFDDALVEVVEQFRAPVVFATVPRSFLSALWRLRVWVLRKRLARRHARLYTLETPLDTLVLLPTTAQPEPEPQLT